MPNPMPYALRCFLTVLGYLPLANPGLVKNGKIEKNLNRLNHHDFEKILDVTNYISFDSVSDSKNIICLI